MPNKVQKLQSLLDFEHKLETIELASKLIRALFTAIAVSVIIATSGILFVPNFETKHLFIQFAAYLGFGLIISIGKSFKGSGLSKKVLNANPNIASAIDIAKGDKAINKSPFWQIHKSQMAKIVPVNPKWRDFFEPSDKIIFSICLVAIIFMVAFPTQLANIFFKSPIQSNPPRNLSIQIIPPQYTNIEPFGLDISKPQEIPINSKIEIEVFGQKTAPRIKFDNEIVQTQNQDAKFNAEMKFTKRAHLSVKTDAGTHSVKLNPIRDLAPKIKGFGGIVAYKGTELSLDINAIDDYSISRALLLIEGQIEGKTIQEAIDLETVPTKEMKGLIVFDTAQSIFSGNRAKARLILFDDAGNRALTRAFSINLKKPEFATQFARALYEIRLDIIRETTPYKNSMNEAFRFYDNERGQEAIIDAKSLIDNAPQKIQSAYQFLLQMASYPEIAGLSDEKTAAIEYALSILESAETLKQAQKIAQILWDMIETERNPPPSTQSLVAQKIQELKDAIKNGASEEEIENLKRQLQSAINQHIEQLAQEQSQSGDMEIEDNSNIDDESISKALDNINSQTNPDDANAQLDALNQMLQNLKVTQNEEGGQGTDYLGAQKEILDETPNTNDLQTLGDKQEALARELMEKNQGKDKNLEDAKDAMIASAEALRNGDTENALEAQRRAIESLLKANDNSQSPSDPMGRKEDANNKGKSSGDNEKILNKAEESKSRSIMQKLRELLGMPDKSEKEKHYYEDLMRME